MSDDTESTGSGGKGKKPIDLGVQPPPVPESTEMSGRPCPPYKSKEACDVCTWPDGGGNG